MKKKDSTSSQELEDIRPWSKAWIRDYWSVFYKANGQLKEHVVDQVFSEFSNSGSVPLYPEIAEITDKKLEGKEPEPSQTKRGKGKRNKPLKSCTSSKEKKKK
eukprot:scpid99106/ scgid11766/ 